MFQKVSKTGGWNENVLGETIGDYLGVSARLFETRE